MYFVSYCIVLNQNEGYLLDHILLDLMHPEKAETPTNFNRK